MSIVQPVTFKSRPAAKGEDSGLPVLRLERFGSTVDRPAAHVQRRSHRKHQKIQVHVRKSMQQVDQAPKLAKCDVPNLVGFLMTSGGGYGFCPSCGKEHRTRLGSETVIRWETPEEAAGRDR